MGRIPTVHSKTYVTPRRPFEKERLDQELKFIGKLFFHLPTYMTPVPYNSLNYIICVKTCFE